MAEALERRALMSAVSWDGGGDTFTWSSPGNWSGDVVPVAGDDVTIATAGNVFFTAASGSLTLASLTMIDARLTVTGAGAVLHANGTGAITGSVLSASLGGEVKLNAATTLENTELYADSDGDVLLPAVTSYSNTLDGRMRVRSDGAGSRIEMPAMATFSDPFRQGGGDDYTYITAQNGGYVKVTGALSGLLWLTLDSASSTLDVSGVTALSGANALDGPNGSAGVDITGGSTITFANVTALNDTELYANNGAQIFFPAVTTYTNIIDRSLTVRADGAGSKIELPAVTAFSDTFRNSSGDDYTHVTASNGGHVKLAGAMAGLISIEVSDASSTVDFSGVTSVAGYVGSGANGPAGIEVTDGAAVTFGGALSLTDTELYARTGGTIALPVATSYSNTIDWPMYVLADGASSKIEMPAMATLADPFRNNTGDDYTHIAASNGGQVKVTGAISGLVSIEIDSASSTMDLTGVTALAGAAVSGAYGPLRVTLHGGSVASLPSVPALTNVEVYAYEGSHALFPAVTTFLNNIDGLLTVLADGAGSRVELPLLATFTDSFRNFGGDTTTHVTASNGGYVKLNGDVVGYVWLTVDGATSTLDVATVAHISGEGALQADNAGVLALPLITTLSNTEMYANTGGQISLPAMTSYTNTQDGLLSVHADGADSRIDMPVLSSFSDIYVNGSGDDHTYVIASAGGFVQLRGSVGGFVRIRIEGANSDVALHDVNFMNALRISAAGGGVIRFPAGMDVQLGVNNTWVLEDDTSSLSVDPTAKIDLQEYDLVIDYATVSPIGSWTGSAYNGVTGLVASGRNGGSWGGNGINSSSADPSGYTTLAVAEASEAFGLEPSDTAIFNSQYVDSTTVLVKFTYGGDANLSGNVDIDDYGQIDFNASTGGVLGGWYNGDFDYNGVQDIDDYGVIDFVAPIQAEVL